MGITPTPFDPAAPNGGVEALVRRDPNDARAIEMVKAVWGSDPRFSDGVNYRFVRSEGRAFPARRCLIPASEFRMGTGDHHYRVTLDGGNFFYLAAVWDPPLADWPLSYRIVTMAAGPDVSPYQSRHGVIIQRRQVMDWLDAAVADETLFEELPKQPVRRAAVQAGGAAAMTLRDLARAPKAAQADLFGPVLPPGLAYAGNIIDAAEEADLIARIEAAGLAPFQFQQWEGKRLTQSFGWTYDFQTGRFARGEPMPDWLTSLRARAGEFAGLEADALEQALLIQYGFGAGIGWHRDRPVFEHVIGLSLGAPATMRFRRRCEGRFERRSAELAPRSIYHLAGEIRNEWEHSILPMDEPRWSVTFRSLRR